MSKLMTRANGKLAFVSADSEWFSLGKTHDQLMTAEEVLFHTGMDTMRFSSHDVLATIGTETDIAFKKMPAHKAVILEEVETGTLHPAGIVGRNREVFQFEELVQPMSDVIDVSGGLIETAGIFDGGAAWFCFLRLPQDVTIGGDDHAMYLFGYDGLASSLIMAPSFKRLACMNQFPSALSAAARGEHAYRLQHRRGARVSVEAVRRTIQLAYTAADEIDRMAKELMAKEMSELDFLAYVDSQLGKPEAPDGEDIPDFVMDRYFSRNNHLLAMFNGSERPQTASTWTHGKPNAWTAFQSLSEWMDHASPVRDQTHSTARRMERLVTGRFDGAKIDALTVLL